MQLKGGFAPIKKGAACYRALSSPCAANSSPHRPSVPLTRVSAGKQRSGADGGTKSAHGCAKASANGGAKTSEKLQQKLQNVANPKQWWFKMTVCTANPLP